MIHNSLWNPCGNACVAILFCYIAVSLYKVSNTSVHSKECHPIHLLHVSLGDFSNVHHYAPILYVALMVKAAQIWVVSFSVLPGK